jgi:hypothetical protein
MVSEVIHRAALCGLLFACLLITWALSKRAQVGLEKAEDSAASALKVEPTFDRRRGGTATSERPSLAYERLSELWKGDRILYRSVAIACFVCAALLFGRTVYQLTIVHRAAQVIGRDNAAFASVRALVLHGVDPQTHYNPFLVWALDQGDKVKEWAWLTIVCLVCGFAARSFLLRTEELFSAASNALSRDASRKD